MGRPITVESNFGYEIRSFLSSVNSAYVTYTGSEVEVNDQKTESSETRFNFKLSVKDYQETLYKEYAESIAELEGILNDTESKYDKLYFIARLIAEIESYRKLLIKKEDGKYTHKLFKFSNTSNEDKFKEVVIDELYCQEYYQWMDYYLGKMGSFLSNLKEITEKTNQADFAIPKSKIPDPNNSTKAKPIEFFDYLFTRNAVANLRRQFLPDEMDYHYRDIKYDPVTETITEFNQDNETGEWEEWKRDFKKYYLDRLKYEFILSRKLIDDHINELKDEAAISLFIKLTLSRLHYLLKTIDRYPDAKKYDSSPKPINALISFIHEKYVAFVPADAIKITAKVKSTETELTKVTQLALPAPQSGARTFKWKANDGERPSTLLYNQLKDAKFIDEETELTTFHNAFNGSLQEHPMKIRWTALAKNKHVNKHLLLYLLNALAEAELIEEDTDNSTFIKKVGFIFCGATGEPLQNLKVSNSTAGKKKKTKPPEEIKIDKAIKVLLGQPVKKIP